MGANGRPAEPHPDVVAEARRLIAAGEAAHVMLRALGGVAVRLQSPDEGPLLPRSYQDIDLATTKDKRRVAEQLITSAGYISDEMFNTLHGVSRMLFYDHANHRKLDVFVGQFSMCHVIPIADRLNRDPLTVPLAELLLTKLQVVELTERDQRDIYNLIYHHPLSREGSHGIEVDFIAVLCAKDWGLWRTTRQTVERCVANLPEYKVPAQAAAVITDRLGELWRGIDDAPKTTGWRLRSRVGDRVRWYEEPEEHRDSQ
ncbi:hypothetical protein EPN29_02060 [bacterium]|nr:MAG: hypothetical protein EPN29_02060 [bacterium]